MPYVSEDLLRCDYVVLISPPSTSLFRLHRAIKYPPNQRSPPPQSHRRCSGSAPRQPAPLSNPLNQARSRAHMGCQEKHSLPLTCVSLPAVPGSGAARRSPCRCAAPAHLPYFTAIIGTVQSSP